MLLAAIALVALATARAGAGSEPTVTREEADLLARTTAIAATNVPAAIGHITRQVRPESSAALDFTAGNLWFRSGRTVEAEACYERAVRKHEGFRLARVNLARTAFANGKAARTAEVCRTLLRADPADAEALLLLGHTLLADNRAVAAEGAFRQCALVQTDAGDALQGLLRALAAQERFGEVASLSAELLERDAHRRDLWWLRANALIGMGKGREALAALDAARRLGLADAAMLALLGDLHLNERQAAEAAACYRQALESATPPFDRVLRGAEALAMAGDLDAAAGTLDSLRQSAGGLAGRSPEERQRILRLEADVLLLRGREDDALAKYAELLRERPLDGPVLMRIGDLQRGRGDADAALAAYERAARIPGHEARALVRQAQVEVDRGRYARAVGLLEAAQSFEDQPHVARYLEQVRRLAR